MVRTNCQQFLEILATAQWKGALTKDHLASLMLGCSALWLMAETPLRHLMVISHGVQVVCGTWRWQEWSERQVGKLVNLSARRLGREGTAVGLSVSIPHLQQLPTGTTKDALHTTVFFSAAPVLIYCIIGKQLKKLALHRDTIFCN